MARRPIRTGGSGVRAARVGFVILLGLATLVFLTYRVGDLFDLWTTRYELVAIFPSVTGLSTDAVVTVAGHRAGKVYSVELVPPEERVDEGNVLVRFWVNAELRQQIRADSRARLRLQGLLGDRYVDILPGSPWQPILQPGDTVPSVPAVELEEHVLEPLAGALADARVTVAHLQRITGRLVRGEGTLGRLLVDDALYVAMTDASTELSALIRQVNEADGTLHRLIHDPALYDQITATLERFDEIGRAALHGDGTMARLLTDDELYERLLGIGDRTELVLAEIEEFARMLTEGGGTVQRLLEDPMLYDQLLKAVVDLQILIADIRAHPRRFRPEINIRLFR